MKKSYFIIFFIFLFFGQFYAFSPYEGDGMGKIVTEGEGKVTKKNNTFVVSGERAVYLFEHESNSPKVHLVKSYLWDGVGLYSAFYSHEMEAVLMIFSTRGIKGNGLKINYLENDKSDYIYNRYYTHGWKYGNGFLFLSNLLKNMSLMDIKGYVEPADIKDIQNYVCMSLDYFDPATKKIEKTYSCDRNFGIDCRVKNDTFYKMPNLKLDLKNDVRYKMYNPKSKKSQNRYSPEGVWFMVKNDFYCVSTPSAFLPKKGSYYDINAIYKLNVEEERFVKVADLPYNKPVYVVCPDDENIFCFMRDDVGKVCKYNVKSKKWVEFDYDIKGNQLRAVGYTDKYFIAVLENKINYGIKLFDFDFTQEGEFIELSEKFWPSFAKISSEQFQSGDALNFVYYPYYDDTLFVP